MANEIDFSRCPYLLDELESYPWSDLCDRDQRRAAYSAARDITRMLRETWDCEPSLERVTGLQEEALLLVLWIAEAFLVPGVQIAPTDENSVVIAYEDIQSWNMALQSGEPLCTVTDAQRERLLALPHLMYKRFPQWLRTRRPGHRRAISGVKPFPLTMPNYDSEPVNEDW